MGLITRWVDVWIMFLKEWVDLDKETNVSNGIVLVIWGNMVLGTAL